MAADQPTQDSIGTDIEALIVQGLTAGFWGGIFITLGIVKLGLPVLEFGVPYWGYFLLALFFGGGALYGAINWRDVLVEDFNE